MTNTLSDALPREIARVTAKKERWQKMAIDHPSMAVGLGITVAIAMMQAHIEQAIRACESGDVVEMMNALAGLKAYNDDD